MKKQRPVNLDLKTIKMPATAVSSILHRATGVAMFFALLFVIAAWAVSLSGPQGYAQVVEIMQGWFGKFVTVGTASALTYHILGGLRHMVMDMGYWEELESGNNSARITIVLWVVLTLIMGVAIC